MRITKQGKDMPKRVKQAYSVENVIRKKFETLEFDGEWERSLGKPDKAFSAIIWGGSSQGKTSFAMQLAKHLCKFGRVAYNSLEEGISHTTQMSLIEHNMQSVGRKFILLDREPWDLMFERMKKRKSPQFLIIDSIQYTGVTVKEYKALKEFMQSKGKGLIFISHARGNEPRGALAEFIRYDVDLKIPVKGYRAFPEGRLNGGGEYFDIWPEKSAEYFANIN